MLQSFSFLKNNTNYTEEFASKSHHFNWFKLIATKKDSSKM